MHECPSAGQAGCVMQVVAGEGHEEKDSTIFLIGKCDYVKILLFLSRICENHEIARIVGVNFSGK